MDEETTTFTYDGDGNLVKKGDGSGTTVYVGDYYEVQGGTVIKYYFAPSTGSGRSGGKRAWPERSRRVAMRKGGVVYYLHGDHLGSTSLTTNSGGGVVAEQRYYPYGETRWSDGTLPTDRQFTGQRHETDLGLYDYKARYYPSTGSGQATPTWAASSALYRTTYSTVRRYHRPRAGESAGLEQIRLCAE